MARTPPRQNAYICEMPGCGAKFSAVAIGALAVCPECRAVADSALKVQRQREKREAARAAKSCATV